MERVAIVGVGLIGGSFALALRQAGFQGRIVGVSSERTLQRARALGVIDESASLEGACATADFIYLAGPIRSIIQTLGNLNPLVKAGTLVTDAGSTKGRISEVGATLRRALFLGGHPMAGKESRGVASADAGLFNGRPYLLTPGRPEDIDTPQARELIEWIRRIGAEPVVLTPERHDRLVAYSSHLPQLLSTALACSLGQHPDSATIAGVAGPGLMDSTRLALSGWEIWKDILDTNRDAILEAMDLFSKEWDEVREHLLSGQLGPSFQQGAEFAARLRQQSFSGPDKPAR